MSGMIQTDQSKVYYTDDEFRAIITTSQEAETMGRDGQADVKIYVFTNHAGVLAVCADFLRDRPVPGVRILQQENKDGVSGYLVTIELKHQYHFRVMGALYTIIDHILSSNNYGEGSEGYGILGVTELYQDRLSDFGAAKVIYQA